MTMNSYFYVDTDDEITSVIGRLRGEKAEEIFLVVPKRALIAQSLVNLRLLDKEAKRHKKKIVFVSPDAHIRKLAEKAGLLVKKYVSKPKDEKTDEALTLAPKSRKLEPWEEAEANKELASIIKKDNDLPPPGMIRDNIGTPSTKIAVGVFSKPENIIARQKAKSAREVVDLKKTHIRRKTMPFPPKKLELASPVNPPIPHSKPVTPPMKKKPILSKKETLPQEDIEKHVGESKMDIARAAPTIKSSESLEIGKNPFKVKKLGGLNKPRSILEGELYTSHEETPPEPVVNYQKEDIENPPLVQPIPPENITDADFQKHEREMANLTLKEKERLRDLWMEQKGLIRGKYVHENASLDLAPLGNAEGVKEEMFSQSSGLFKTTHRKVGGSGKIVDLRVKNRIQTALPKVNFTQVKRVEEQDKKVILLPLINIRFLSIFIVIILLVLAILAGIIIPDAHITIKPKVAEDNLNLTIWISGEVSQADFNERVIPGKPVHFKVTEEKTFPTSGSQEVKESAQGQVTIYNSTTNPLSLKQNATLTDSNGKKYFTQAPALVPAGKSSGTITGSTETINPGSVVVSVVAEGTSSDYNLKTGSTLTIPGLDDSEYSGGISVEVKKEISGGENRNVKIVTRDDLEKAKTELIEKARQDSQGELEKNLDENMIRIVKPESLTIEDTAFTTGKAEGDEAVSFSANLTVTFFTLAFSQEELESLGKSVVEGESSEKGGTVKMNNYNVTDAKPLENKMEVNTNISYQLKSQVDAGEIRKELTAKKKNEADDYLRGNKNIDQYTLDLWPSWPARLPLIERRIKVEVQ